MTNVNTPFSALPIAVGALTGSEILPADQAGTTKQVTAGQIAALASSGIINSGAFVLVGAVPANYPSGRRIAVGASLSLVDGGAGTTITIGTTSLTGDVTSSANSFATTVAKINGVPLGSTVATAGNILIGSGTQWVSNSVSGDISITSSGAVTVGAINGVALGSTTATAGNLLIGSGTQWVTHAMSGDATITSGGVISVNSLHSGAFANPTASVVLSAVNGSATTAMRSDAAPALSQAIVPTWTGTHTFAPTSGAATQAIVVTQSLTGGNGSAAVIGSVWNVTNTGWNGGALPSNDAVAINYAINGSAIQGGQHGLEVTTTLLAATSGSNALKQYAGIAGSFASAVNDGGTAITKKGAGYGFTGGCTLSGTATFFVECTGAEIGNAITAGASADYFAGWTVVNLSNHVNRGITFDMGYGLSVQTGGQTFKNGFFFGNQNGIFPVGTDGTMWSTTAGTVTTGVDFSNLTISGSAWTSPGANLTGAGIWNAVFRPTAGAFAAGVAQIYTTSGGGSNGLTITMFTSGGTNDGGFFSAAGSFLFVNPSGTNNVNLVTGGGALGVGTTATVATFNGTTDASSTSVAGVVNAGGSAIAKKLYVGTDINAVGGNIIMGTATKTLVLKQGANGTVGTFVCNGVTPVTINNTNVAISDAIIISLNTVGGTVGAAPDVKTITASTGFTAACTAADTSTYNYAIIKNAA